MAAWLGFIVSDPDDVPTPDANKIRIFVDAGSSLLSYKNSVGDVFTFTGPAGPPGPAGPSAYSYFPGGWT